MTFTTVHSCGHPMRAGACNLDADHRGRHTTRSFYCEGCGKRRAGTPAGQSEVRLGDGSVDDTFDFCFLCMRGLT